MAKSGTVPAKVLDDLADAFMDMKAKRSRVEMDVRRRFKPQIEECIESETRVIERAFAVQFEEVRQQGATRKELVKIIGDGTAEIFRHYAELGGGVIAGRKTGAERASDRAAALEEEKQGMFERLGVTEEFICDRGFPAFRFEPDFWGYVDRGSFLPGYGEDFEISKWQPFIKTKQETMKELVEYVKRTGE